MPALVDVTRDHLVFEQWTQEAKDAFKKALRHRFEAVRARVCGIAFHWGDGPKPNGDTKFNVDVWVEGKAKGFLVAILNGGQVSVVPGAVLSV